MNKDGLSRRDFLKRGAALGGALVWVAPVVQVVGMRPAFAQSVSPACTDSFAIKFEEGGLCENIWNQTTTNTGKCLDVSDMGVNPIEGAMACSLVSLNEVSDTEWIVTLAPGCDFLVSAIEFKLGQPFGGCQPGGEWDGANTVTFDSGSGISHVELVFGKFPVVVCEPTDSPLSERLLE